ncbi:MAG TPA: hypothetical protein VKA60_26700 [Blastocatellia bacterium]|nr:hypothetical protein [Blastocatellia bacterium]
MKNRLGFALLFLLGFVLGVMLIANDARAQQPAPTDKPAAKPAATDKADSDQWTVQSSIELGVRGLGIHGDADKYRSDLNYQPGFRVFDADLLVKSKNNDGPLFDSLMVNSFGWGKDPNRYLRVDVEKSGAYRFDANYRRFDYFNSLRNFALNQHISNTEYRQGDFNLSLLPSNPHFRVNLGYSLDRNSGPAVTTYDYQRDEFPVLAPSRYGADDYRVGFDAKVWKIDVSFLQGWRFFKDDTTYLIDKVQAGNNTTNTSVLNSYRREQPTRGDTPYTRLSLHTFLANRLDITGRLIYANTTSKFTMLESATGKDSSGNTINLDAFTALGATHRPDLMGDVGVTFRLTDRIRISNTFRANNFRIDGANDVIDNLLRSRLLQGNQVALPPVFTNTEALRTINYRRYLNLLEGDIEIHPRFTLHLGYRYTDRRIDERGEDNNLLLPPTGVEPETDTFTNSTNTFILGFRAKPLKVWSVYFDMEHGETDNVFTRTAAYDYTNFRVRSILRPTKTIAINTSLVTKDNTNPTLAIDGRNFGADVNVRNFTTSFDWTPANRFFINTGYTYSRVTSEAQVIYYLASNVKVNGMSRYFLKDNFAFVTAFYEFHPRVRLYAGYRFHRDPGQEDRLSSPATGLLIASYPYQFTSPEAKLSVKLHERLDWIVGYQYFDFKEKFVNNQFYQAHLPYTSLRFYFGRRE